jgi:hypothetical protein
VLAVARAALLLFVLGFHCLAVPRSGLLLLLLLVVELLRRTITVGECCIVACTSRRRREELDRSYASALAAELYQLRDCRLRVWERT